MATLHKVRGRRFPARTTASSWFGFGFHFKGNLKCLLDNEKSGFKLVNLACTRGEFGVDSVPVP
jgi:hypothetical protein